MSDKLLFTEKEWNAAMPGVVKAMTEYLRPYRTPIYKHYDTYGDGWGSGSYMRLGDKVFILTNEHVAAAREQGTVLTNQFDGQEDIRQIVGDHAAYPAPLDLALLPVDMEAWSESTNTSNAIEIEQRVHEKPCAHQQHRRERNLTYHKALVKPELMSIRGGTSRIPESGVGSNSRRLPSRRQSEEDAGRERDCESEQKHAPVELYVH